MNLEHEAAEPELEYRVCESVWDSCAILGLREVGLAASALMLVSSLLNVGVQTYLCYVLLSSSSFNPEDPWKLPVPEMRRWRSSFAHSHKELDTAGTSLASRVCGKDGALSLASSQTSLLDEINSYLDMEPADIQHKGLGTGATLCAACLFLFAVLVLRELRRIVVCVLAFLALPRGCSTRVEDGAIVVISRPRLAVIMVVSAVRVFVAVALLGTGCVWLSSTSSITDLILNAAGLGFIMDLDEMLFDAAVPMRVQRFVRGLAPLRVRRPPLNLEALLPLLTSITLVFMCIINLVLPSIADMLEVKRALCGGQTDFVVATSPLGLVPSQETAAFRSSDRAETLEQKAVRELIGRERGGPTPELSLLHTSASSFLEAVDLTMVTWAETNPCSDWDVFNNGSLLQAMPAPFMAVRHMTQVHVGLSLADHPWTCADYVGFCDTVDVVRVMCPVACGCADPTSGLFLMGSKKGCPMACQPLMKERLDNLPCTDLDVANTMNWTRYWRAYARHMASVVDASVNHSTFAESKIQVGCASKATFALTGTDFCDKRDPLPASSGLGTILGFCPATCCRGGPDAPPDCPPSCQTAAG